jgi:hypothetical protein
MCVWIGCGVREIDDCQGISARVLGALRGHVNASPFKGVAWRLRRVGQGQGGGRCVGIEGIHGWHIEADSRSLSGWTGQALSHLHQSKAADAGSVRRQL